MNKQPRISIIVATGRNREIGAKNKLLWKIPEELKRFREITTGHPIIMGRKTHESIGRILPGRLNIVITRNPSLVNATSHPGGGSSELVFVNSLEEAISHASSLRGVHPTRQSQLGNDVQLANVNHDGTGIASEGAPRNDVGGVDGEIFIIGGAQIFEQALPLADKLYVTLVDADFPEADSFFPEYKGKFTKKVFEKSEESSGFKYKFLELEK